MEITKTTTPEGEDDSGTHDEGENEVAPFDVIFDESGGAFF